MEMQKAITPPQPNAKQIILIAGCGTKGDMDYSCKPQTGYHIVDHYADEVFKWISSHRPQLAAYCFSAGQLRRDMDFQSEFGLMLLDLKEEISEAMSETQANIQKYQAMARDPKNDVSEMLRDAQIEVDKYVGILQEVGIALAKKNYFPPEGQGGIKAEACYTVDPDPTDTCKPTFKASFHDLKPEDFRGSLFDMVLLDSLFPQPPGAQLPMDQYVSSLMARGLSLLKDGGILWLEFFNIDMKTGTDNSKFPPEMWSAFHDRIVHEYGSDPSNLQYMFVYETDQAHKPVTITGLLVQKKGAPQHAQSAPQSQSTQRSQTTQQGPVASRQGLGLHVGSSAGGSHATEQGVD